MILASRFSGEWMGTGDRCRAGAPLAVRTENQSCFTFEIDRPWCK